MIKRVWLREAREQRGWTQERLEAESGVAQATISKIERGEVGNPSSNTVERLELALRLKRGTLVFGHSVPESRTA